MHVTQLSKAVCLAAISLSVHLASAQPSATVHESWRTFKTYEFSDPDPVPIYFSDVKIYPYHKYEGYTHEPVDREWKVVTLENEYIAVYVLPEVGGKVWGAIEKSTGEEFIYRNEVMKFRNISMRGPWTSGGIEFNFGIIGHHPSTATPVDYVTMENEDGSVSCIVGNVDLPSRTQWRVEIRLAPDKAYFETRVNWYNPTHASQAYYNWMTGAAVASDDLEFYCPGNAYLDHPGKAHPWPYDTEGRNLARYDENDFGPAKSYHVVGVYDDFFGGYYHERDFGFGHWAPYEEIPGQKLWLWAQSRSGGIWEDLLTDTDGQYIEFQAGRLLNQYSQGRNQNPITEGVFDPGRADIWRELWFPVKRIGGLSEVSPKGVLHVQQQDDQLIIGVNALEQSSGTLEILCEGEVVASTALVLAPMEVHLDTVSKPEGNRWQVRIQGMDLVYDVSKVKEIARPFVEQASPEAYAASLDRTYRRALELIKLRNYKRAEAAIDECLAADPIHLGALRAKADLLMRSARYKEALQFAQQALRLDTYDPATNHTTAAIYRGLGDHLNALECLGWAARSLAFKADAYAQMAEIYFIQDRYAQANRYARNALDFNRFHMGARQLLALIGRVTGNAYAAARQRDAIRTLDPLNHFVFMEGFLTSGAEADKKAVAASHRSELSYQTMLELALYYHAVGRDQDALEVLHLAPEHPLIDLWIAYLIKDTPGGDAQDYLAKVETASPDLIFPYRQETFKVLSWAQGASTDWHIDYYEALAMGGVGRFHEALDLMEGIGQEIRFAPVFLTRALLKERVGEDDPLPDLQHAVLLDKTSWRSWLALIGYWQKHPDPEQALLASAEAYDQMPDNYAIGMAHARSLVSAKNYEAAIDVLSGLRVLPFEGAYAGRRLWEQAHLGAALDAIEKSRYDDAVATLEAAKTWPENLGVGSPYHPDLRRMHYLLAVIHKKAKNKKGHRQAESELIDNTTQLKRRDIDNVLPLRVLRQNARSDDAELFTDETPSSVGSWIEAALTGDAQSIRALETQDPKKFSGVEYELLKRILALD